MKTLFTFVVVLFLCSSAHAEEIAPSPQPRLTDAEIKQLSFEALENMLHENFEQQEGFSKLSEHQKEAHVLNLIIRASKTGQTADDVLERAKNKYVATKSKEELFDLIVQVAATSAAQEYFSRIYRIGWQGGWTPLYSAQQGAKGQWWYEAPENTENE